VIFEDLTNTKWNILKQIAKKPQSPKEIASKLNSTISNISQQLKLLEAQGYLNKKRIDLGVGSRKKITGRIIYGLKQEKAYILALNEQPKTFEINLTNETKFLLNIISNDVNTNSMLNLYINYNELLSKANAIYLLDSSNTEIHLLILTNETEAFRKQSSITINNQKIIFWSHTLDEIKKGLSHKEKYFEDKIKQAKTIIDEKNILNALK
jgi:DNA-binding MarR family transcriptional regulator